MRVTEQAEAQRRVNEFNHRHPIGTLVFAYPGCRPEDGAGTRLVTRTRTAAQLSASGHPVVWVEGEGAYISLTHVDPVAEDVWEEARKAEKPVEPEAAPESAARLSPEREAEIAARAEASTPGPWGFYDGDNYADVAADLQVTGRGSYSYREKVARLEDENYWDDAAHEDDDEEQASEQMVTNAAFIAHAREDVPALLAELAAVRAERDQARAELSKYVGNEPAIAEEMDYLSRCLNAVRDVCDTAENQATRWENPLPVPEWVEPVRAAANGERADNPNDNRRRLFIDGKGNGWISICRDEGTEWIVPVQPEAAVEQDVRDVADETGSLREIGRCW